MTVLAERELLRNSPKIKSSHAAPMVSVYDGRQCVGFILARGKSGFEAFDCDERSVGLYPTQCAAAAALDVVRP
jgi:hypothetical protein